MSILESIPFQVPDSDEAQRLFHGRGQAYPGYAHITIDWLPPVVLITLYQPESSRDVQALVRQIQRRIPQYRSIQVQYRYQTGSPVDCLAGESIQQFIVAEQALKYHIRLGQTQNTGLFLDMKNGRHWVQLHSHGRKILNLFAYTCAFSVAAIAGGARQVVNLDMRRSSLSMGRANHRLNKQDVGKVRFEAVNIFKSFGRIRKYGPYDGMICDPPSYQKGSVDIVRDYSKILRRIPEFMKPGSWIMLCLNSPHHDFQFLLQLVAAHCPVCQFVEEIRPPADFVEKRPEKGLKVLIFRYGAGEGTDESSA